MLGNGFETLSTVLIRGCSYTRDPKPFYDVVFFGRLTGEKRIVKSSKGFGKKVQITTSKKQVKEELFQISHSMFID